MFQQNYPISFIIDNRAVWRRMEPAFFPTHHNPIAITEVYSAGDVTQLVNNESLASTAFLLEVFPFFFSRDKCQQQLLTCRHTAVRPDPPSNCSVLNQTADAVEVWCRPGFDGGHPQLFQFEIFDTQSAVLLYNKSGRYPHLRVGNLESGVKLFIQISSYNRRGRSALVPLEAYTIKIAEKQTGTKKRK